LTAEFSILFPKLFLLFIITRSQRFQPGKEEAFPFPSGKAFAVALDFANY
jgi:hypothetical protein